MGTGPEALRSSSFLEQYSLLTFPKYFRHIPARRLRLLVVCRVCENMIERASVRRP